MRFKGRLFNLFNIFNRQNNSVVSHADASQYDSLVFTNISRECRAKLAMEYHKTASYPVPPEPVGHESRTRYPISRARNSSKIINMEEDFLAR